MKKALVVWLVLLVMAVSAVGFAEVNSSNLTGDWIESSEEWIYTNDFLGVTFTCNKNSWGYSPTKSLAKDDGMSLTEWNNAVKEGELGDYKTGSWAMIMYARTKPGHWDVRIMMDKLEEADSFSLEEYLVWYRSYLEENWTKNGCTAEFKTINFLGKEQTYIDVQYVKNYDKQFWAFVPIVKDGYLAFFTVKTQVRNNISDVLSKFCSI